MSYSWGAGRSRARGDGIPVGRSALDGQLVVAGNIGQSVGTVGTAPTATSAPTGDVQRLAAELAPMVDVWQRLLACHVPDRAGRCRTCTKGGTGLPSTPWPCSIHGIADLARRRHDRDHR